MLPLLVSAIGLGVEIGGWYSNVRSLQSAADAAAVAAVYEVRGISGTIDSTTDLLPRATLEAARNGLDTSNGDTISLNYFNEISPSSYTTDYSTNNTAVEVILTKSVTLYFVGWITDANTITANAQAVAVEQGSGDACIMALNDSDDSSLKISGNITMTMDCGIAVSSTSSKGLDLSGNSDIDVNEICVKGGASVSGNNTFHDATPKENCNTAPDPLSGLAEPSNADDTCLETDYDLSGNSGTVTLLPGVYCNGIKISGNSNNIVFTAGTYILAGDNGLSASGGSNVFDGSAGVTFYITDNHGDGNYPDVNLSGNNTFNLEAPSSGDYAGVLFYNDSSAASSTSGAKFNVSGNNTFSNFDGVVYYPNHELSFSGNSSSSSSCGPKLVSDTVSISGNIDVYGGGSGCAGDNVSIGVSVIVGLVE